MSWGAISAMGHVSIRTTRFDESIHDAVEVLGLRETSRDDRQVYLAAAGVHHELTYVRSDIDALDHIGLVAPDAAALARIRARVEDRQFEIVSDAPLEAGIRQGFSFVGPEGFVYEIYLGMEPTDAHPRGFGPDRFGHVNLHPKDVAAYTDFLVDVLDFRVSDTIGDDFAVFLRCNPDHHGIALIAGRGTMHHHAWQTQGIADLGRLGDRLDDRDRRLIWGPVRHGAGHNIAAYFVEPAGDVIELYTDLEQIYDDERPPVHWVMEGSRWFNRWGVYNGEEFRTHGLFPAPRSTS
jgi:catechol 2,3-dioxygenase